MKPGRRIRHILALWSLAIAPASLLAQGTLEDYQRAERFLPANAEKLVQGLTFTPPWTSRAATSDAGDTAALKQEALSPNGEWALYVEHDDLQLRNRRTGEVSSLTTDGIEGQSYASWAGLKVAPVKVGEAPPAVFFSPDSRKLLTYRLDYRRVPTLSLQETAAGQRPRVRNYPYPLPGDEVAEASWVIFDLPTRARVDLKWHPVAWRPNDDPGVRWSDDGKVVFFLEQQAGYKKVWLRAADPLTGEVRTVLEETSATSVDRYPIIEMLSGGRQLLWSSERDGWRHLYLVDAHGSRIQRQLTHGNWVVAGRDVAHVDPRAGWIYFLASGREAGRDPYYRHLYRIRRDGTGLELLTPEDADHSVSFGPSGQVFADTYSRVDQPPVSVLRDVTGKRLRILQQADIAPLLATGWRPPEPFYAKARDGATDLHGVLFRPSNFDASRRYPVIDSIYPGPQATKVPRAFGLSSAQSLAELGFIVVMLDGLGTPGRSRAFRDVSYGHLEEAGGLEDHITGLQQLAHRYPYLDLTRVGIYGHSAGGYAAARAILEYPDFYKVAVSSAGNHDQRTYHAGWGERYQGYPVGTLYDPQANAPLASRLEGRLLLAYGTLDDNVHPANTLQLIDALIAADKDFDVLVLPNRDHRSDNDPYFIRRQWDYFVEHLLQVTPPPAAIRAAACGKDSGRLDADLDRALRDWHTPGMTVAVVKNDRVVLAKGYGLRRQGSSARVDERTLFALGSTSKAFAAASVAMLVSDHAVNWDDRVRMFLPWFEVYDPRVSAEITLRDLLAHRVGTRYDDENKLRAASSDARDQLERSRALKPVVAFRSGYAYSNNMFIASGLVVAAVSGKTWATFARERLWEPLGMRDTGADLIAARNNRNAASPHAIASSGEPHAIAWEYPDAVGVPSGGINSNAGDMAQWLRFQLGEGSIDGKALISRDAFKAMHTPQTVIANPSGEPDIQSQFPDSVRATAGMRTWAYGMGWYVTQYRGRRFLYHSGTVEGFRAAAGLMPDEGVAVYVGVNRTSRLPMAVMLRLLDEYLPTGETTDWSAEFLKAQQP